ncbi:hypothetical protein GCM10011512_23390 [Tersicoccus solisilvae]|uniref:Glycosyltransferase RgtA/B/C/D-like domain-containing protein n=1 Tax=Tersicoccus solisilvae TaxID=1882339 RepID=A0ABQ1PEN5_9MICC|nr:phospholipid carrier-dependent glycosyltransferase [Tersicoccus solisilvae]GGC95675.1 hypothetical protein GCM10011512_23390 [Tersicoccus solisilvae]
MTAAAPPTGAHPVLAAPTNPPADRHRDRIRRLRDAVAGSTDERPRGRQVPGTAAVLVLAAVVGLAVCVYTTGNGSNLAYSDAQSHLTIARRLLDSKAPGFQQLGTVWLPVPHLLLAPFVQSLWLFSTGWAAALLGTLALMATTAALFRTAARLGLNRWGRWAAVLLLLTNPSVLYTYTTALTEPVLIMGLTAGTAGLAHWAVSRRRVSAGELAVFAGIPSAGAVLSRYEGWALVLTGTVVVAVITWRRARTVRETVTMAVAFAALPAAAVLWWLAYNWGVYGNPLEFMFGQYSAYAQQSGISTSGLLTTKGNLGLTLWTYHWSLLETAGTAVLVAALAGAVVAAFRWRLGTETLLLAVAGSAWAFSLVSLYLGQTAINNDHSLPTTWWNNRFALTAMPLVALGVATAVDALTRRARWRLVAVPAVLALLIGQNAWFLADLGGRSAIVAEGEMSAASTTNSTAAARWLHAHYDGGGILMDESARGNAILPTLGIPLREIDNRAAGGSFERALADPAAHDRWILVNVEGAGAKADTGPSDLVFRAIDARPDFGVQYRLVFRTATHCVYERVEAR